MQRPITIGAGVAAVLSWLMLVIAYLDASLLARVPLYAGLLPLISLGVAGIAWVRFRSRDLLFITLASLAALMVEVASVVHLFNTFNTIQRYKGY